MKYNNCELKYVKGPDGAPLSLHNLPAIGTKRWVSRRKAEVVAAVDGGLLTIDEACKRYDLTVEEFLSWQMMLTSYGTRGLRTTQLKIYRS